MLLFWLYAGFTVGYTGSLFLDLEQNGFFALIVLCRRVFAGYELLLFLKGFVLCYTACVA